MRQIYYLSLCFIILISVDIGCSTRSYKKSRDLELHEKKIEENNKNGCIPGCMLFEGDSNIELIDLQEYFSNPTCNYALRGSTSKNLLARMDKVAQVKPDVIVMLVGGNDLLKSVPIGDIEKNYADLIENYQTLTKKVYCISNLPVHPKFRLTNSDIVTLNKLLEQVCAKRGATYISLYPFLLKNGGLNPDYARDPVHLNKAGQEIFIGILKQHLIR
jgi:hypothetical protein